MQDEPAEPFAPAHDNGPGGRWLRPLGAATAAVVVGLSLPAHPRPGLGGEGLLVTVAIAVFAVAVLQMLRGPRGSRPETAASLALAGAAAVLAIVQGGGAAIAGLFMASSYAAIRLPLPRALAVAAVAIAALAVALAGASRSAGSVLSAVLGLVAFFVLSIFARRVSDAHSETERLLGELRESQRAQAEAAALHERARIAREIHDVLAHSLSGLMLQLEGARILAAAPSPNGRLAETLDRAHHLARAGLEEARRAVGALRDGDLPGPERLQELVADFSRDSGVPAALAVEGEARPLGSEASLTLFRVAQEALTNARRHARPDRVEVVLAYERDGVRLVVEDHREAAGAAVASAAAGAPLAVGRGYGLTGMRERAELLGGRLETGPTADGFRVALWVPA